MTAPSTPSSPPALALVTAHPNLPSGGGASSGFDRPVAEDRVERTASALRSHGFDVHVVSDRAAARTTLLGLLPPGAEILTATSQTLAALDVLPTLEDPARFRNIRADLTRLRTEGKIAEMRKIGSAPQYVIGSVHAVTEQGQVLVASATGSQLAPYVYGAQRVVWVVGSQKIVPDLETAIRRVYEHAFALEDARARSAYGMGSAVRKLLIVNEELPGRISILLVQESLGF